MQRPGFPAARRPEPSPLLLLYHNAVHTDEELQLWQEYKTGSRSGGWYISKD